MEAKQLVRRVENGYEIRRMDGRTVFQRSRKRPHDIDVGLWPSEEITCELCEYILTRDCATGNIEENVK